MKRLLLILSLASAAYSLQGQIMKVTSIEDLNLTSSNDMVTQAVALSPQGDYILLSSDTKKGLIKWDLATGHSQVLTNEEGTGGDVRISDDGKQIVYGQVTYAKKRRHEAVKTIDLATGKSRTLVKPTRDLQGIALDKMTVTTVTDGRIKRHHLKDDDRATASVRPILTKHHLKMYITRDGATTQLAPNGTDERYIWASLSPDGNKVLYYVSGHGTFVCDVDGSNVIGMGNLTAPKWWDDNTIVGMNEVDDEYRIIASSIVARTLDGREQVLTGDDVIATYPLPSSQSGKLVFSTPDGKVYLIQVTR